MQPEVNLVSRYQQLLREINSLEQKFNRPNNSVTLLAVSKTQDIADIATLADAGLVNFAENYLQEALPKISALRDKNICWHFIGHLQSKKSREIALNFSWVHTLSRLVEAEKLAKFCLKNSPPLNVCIQIKLDDNPNKNGLSLTNLPQFAQQISTIKQLKLRGLMTILPANLNFEEQQNYFQICQQAMEQLNQQGYNLDTLSMGMTQDYQAAISKGATMLRIGTKLFGERK